MEIRSAPGLLGRRLRKRRASLCEFSEQALDVGDLDPGQDQGSLARREFGEVRLMNAAEVQASLAARHRAVERRCAVKEVDRKPQFVPEESRARRYVANEQDGDDGSQRDVRHCNLRHIRAEGSLWLPQVKPRWTVSHSVETPH